MSDNIHRLTGHVFAGESNPELIDALEILLDKAKKGEIVSMAWAHYSGRANDTVGTAWEVSGGTSFEISAAISLLSARFTNMLIEAE